MSSFRPVNTSLVSLVYIPGHCGITGNDLADENAHKLANSIASGTTEATDNITVTDVYKLATGIVMRSWQRKWNEESTGRTTFSFIPEVGTKVIFPRRREVGVSYCRILLHDTMLKWRYYMLSELAFLTHTCVNVAKNGKLLSMYYLSLIHISEPTRPY